jgi:hypothetical protein
MGTPADFYIGTGADAEWLGSIAFDGYRIDDMEEADATRDADCAACWAIKSATNADDYRRAVAELLACNDDATKPEQGWPWPWNTSDTTDYAYAFCEKRPPCPTCGHAVDGAGVVANPEGAEWPDMTARQNVTFGKRSGMIIVGA